MEDKGGGNFEAATSPAYDGKTFAVSMADGGISYSTQALAPAISGSLGSDRSVTLDLNTGAAYGRTISNATEFYNLTLTENRAVSWSVIADIVLPDDGTWAGPTNFSGTFYGNGHQILNLKMTNGVGATGLFSSLTNGAKLYDFTVNVSSTPNLVLGTTGGIYFGGVVGSVAGGTETIKGVTVKGALSLRTNVVTGYHMIGGFIGENYSGTVTIEDCASEVDITIDYDPLGAVANGSQQFYVGGFIGKSHQNVTIRNSYAGGKVDVSLNGNRPLFAGALIGYSETGTAVIENCYASGAVTLNNVATSITNVHSGVSYAAGGFIGCITGGTVTVSNSAAVGEKAIAAYAGTITEANYGTGRVTGVDKMPATYANNFARKGMLTGSTPAGSPNDSDGAADTKAGLAKELEVLQTASTWTDPVANGGLGWSSDVWDFSGLTTTPGTTFSSWPKLRNRSHI
jgi:hypothetical protein